MPSRYQVIYRGGDGRSTKSFSTLAAVQEYVKERWSGTDYIRGAQVWTHCDYNAQFELKGCSLFDLGSRKSHDPNSDDFWSWEWKVLS